MNKPRFILSDVFCRRIVLGRIHKRTIFVKIEDVVEELVTALTISRTD